MKFVLRSLFLQLALALAVIPALQAEDSAEFVALRTKAEQGNSIAQYNLGLAYAKGHGTTVDLPEAFVWLTLASENGTRGPALESTLDALSPSQLAEAKRRLDAKRLKAKAPGAAAPAPAAAKPAAAPAPAPATAKTPPPAAAQPAPVAAKPAPVAATPAAQPQAATPKPAAVIPAPAPAAAKPTIPPATTPPATVAVAAPKPAPASAPVPVVNPLQAPLNEARQTISRLTAKNEELTAALLSKPAPDSAADKLAEVEDKLATALRSYSLLRDENDGLKANAESASAERIALGNQLESAQSSIASLNDQLASANVVAAQASALKAQLRQTQDQLASVSSDNNQLRGRLAASLPSPSLLSSPTRPGAVPTALNPEPVASVAPAPEWVPELTPEPSIPVSAPQPTVAAAPARSTPAIDTSVERTHTVAAGETLSAIALRYYGKSVRWAEILDANRTVLRDEKSLRVGMQLRIPALR